MIAVHMDEIGLIATHVDANGFVRFITISALYMPSDRFSAQLSYQWQDDEVGGRRQVARGDNLIDGVPYKDYEFGAIQLEPSEREVSLAALELEFGLGFATLTSRTSYYEHNGKGISDNSGVYARNQWFGFYGSSPRPIAQAERFYDDSAVTQECRLVSEGEKFVDWTVGLYYTDQDYDLGQNSYLVGYIPYLNAYPFLRPKAPARLGVPEILPPVKLQLEAAVRPLRLNLAQVQAAPSGAVLAPPLILPPRFLFDSLDLDLRKRSPGLRAVKRLYRPSLSPLENLPGGRMNERQRYFVERVWEPDLRPRLVAAGFRRVGSIA